MSYKNNQLVILFRLLFANILPPRLYFLNVDEHVCTSAYTQMCYEVN